MKQINPEEYAPNRYTLSYFCKLIQQEFQLSTLIEKRKLLPSAIYSFALDSGLKTSIIDIRDWEDFEMGTHDYSISDFGELMEESRCFMPDDEILFVSDELLKIDQCLGFRLKTFNAFALWYEKQFNMEFFQPSDYLLLSRESGNILLIHHEGKLITIFSKAN
ncbi:hypothetical protein [Chitinophaga sp. Cy-1792]|uniref:hypothetical protein n=1 Tax=Chitinophaga sp. Cy-1792 TaxID=2608339 RepID=UPI0014210AA6|nr:hypothetical protein [Chitinophaga sp. Cy-1792]NIG55388.1 hypothetical protein [Chitinophaga sp. Cy-1792]